MSDIAYRYDSAAIRGRTDWGAIWSGMFAFLAIWSVFGALGLAIFASNANPNAAHPVTGQSTGMAIWAIILTIIAMYVAGRETGRLAAVNNRHDGLIHGMIMFGLSVASVIVLVAIAGATVAGASTTGVAATAHSGYVLGAFADIGWAGFIALFLGWLAAMFGASSGVFHKQAATVAEPRQIRPAA